jgi:ABC-type polysaccharide/polyol phosphate export permease
MARKDLSRSLCQSWFWLSMGWMDIVHRYRGSLLGPFWLTLTSGIFVAVMGPLYASLFNLNLQDYFPHLAIGIISWNFISATLSECCRAFIDAGPQMKQMVIPRLSFIFQILWRNLIVFVHSLPIILIALWLCAVPIGPWALMIVPGLALVCVNLLFIGVLFAICSARFRDVVPIVGSLLTMAFFLSPVLWNPAIQRVPGWVIAVNPFAAYLSLMRAPLLGNAVEPELLFSAAISTVGLGVITAWVFARYRKYIVYWV